MCLFRNNVRLFSILYNPQTGTVFKWLFSTVKIVPMKTVHSEFYG